MLYSSQSWNITDLIVDIQSQWRLCLVTSKFLKVFEINEKNKENPVNIGRAKSHGKNDEE